jgi:hypothetical protein
MEKTDFKKTMKALWQPPAGNFTQVEVPSMQFVKINGHGNPNTAAEYSSAVQWLYSVSYALKFASKLDLKRDYTVPPLEGLWWADDMQSFVSREKDKWSWTAMIMAPEWITREMFEAAVENGLTENGHHHEIYLSDPRRTAPEKLKTVIRQPVGRA